MHHASPVSLASHILPLIGVETTQTSNCLALLLLNTPSFDLMQAEVVGLVMYN